MKKNIEKILASASIVIAFVLTIILLVTVFGGIEQQDFDNNLVKGLFITLAVLYFVTAGGLLVMLFVASDAVKEITLRSEQGGSCKATLGVIRKLVKESFRDVQGVKTGKVALVVNENGVKLRVTVKITDRDVFETETYLRTLLEEVFKGALGFRFHTIEFKVVEFQAKFKPDKSKIDAEVAEKVAAHTPNYASVPGAVEQQVTETAAESEEVAEAAESAAEADADEIAAESAAEADADEIAAESAAEEVEAEEIPAVDETEDNDAEAVADDAADEDAADVTYNDTEEAGADSASEEEE